MGNNKMLKVLWSIVAVIFFGSAGFLTYSYFSTGDNKTTKVTNSSSTKEKSSSSTSKKENPSSTTDKDKTSEDNKDDSNSQNNDKKETTKSDSKENTETEKKSETKTTTNNNSVEKNSSSKETTQENSSGNGRTYEYNGRKLSPITGLGTTGKVFSSQKEALAYGQSEIERLVKEDKKSRQYAVGRVLYDDNSLAGWTVDIYEDTTKKD